MSFVELECLSVLEYDLEWEGPLLLSSSSKEADSLGLLARSILGTNVLIPKERHGESPQDPPQFTPCATRIHLHKFWEAFYMILVGLSSLWKLRRRLMGPITVLTTVAILGRGTTGCILSSSSTVHPRFSCRSWWLTWWCDLDSKLWEGWASGYHAFLKWESYAFPEVDSVCWSLGMKSPTFSGEMEQFIAQWD
jgi:hypothetical protein